MSARVCTPPMDLSRNDLNLLPSCPGSSALGSSSSLPSSATIPTTHHHHSFYNHPSNSSSSSSPSTSSSSSGMDLCSTKLRQVSRNLFGAPDPRSAQFARDKVKEIQLSDTKRWNFDFDKETPLHGRFKWERVPTLADVTKQGSDKGGSSVPTAYACHRLPFLASASGATKQIVRSTPSSSSECKVPQQLYYTPLTSSSLLKQDRDPLLIVREEVPSTRPQSSSTSVVQAGPSAVTDAETKDQSISHKSELLNPVVASGSDDSPKSTCSSSASRNSPSPTSTSSILRTPEENKSTDKSEDLIKVQVSKKPTKITDFMKEKKRKAPSQTAAAGGKKAAL